MKDKTAISIFINSDKPAEKLTECLSQLLDNAMMSQTIKLDAPVKLYKATLSVRLV